MTDKKSVSIEEVFPNKKLVRITLEVDYAFYKETPIEEIKDMFKHWGYHAYRDQSEIGHKRFIKAEELEWKDFNKNADSAYGKLVKENEKMKNILKGIISMQRSLDKNFENPEDWEDLVHYREDTVLTIDCLYALGIGTGQIRKDDELPSVKWKRKK